MKTFLLRVGEATLALGALIASTGCEGNSGRAAVPVYVAPASPTEPEEPASLNAPAPAQPVAAAPADADVKAAEAPTPAPTLAAAAPGVVRPIPPPPPNATPAAPTAKPSPMAVNQPVPEKLKMSPALGEVVKLAQGGVSEEVMLAYINNSSDAYYLGADEILYLNDLGVSTAVLTALIQRDASPDAAAARWAATQTNSLPEHVALKTPATNIYPSQIPVPAGNDSNVTYVTPTYVTPPTVATAPDAAQPVSVTYFNDALAPYGNWVDVEDYGRCWQPTVAVVNSYWRPYSDHGRWLWSDCGWYWTSDYSWGWAPFHYGRWYSHHRHGWVWQPDTVWAPAWVSWRSTRYHCGWAPLPPEACYTVGAGFTYRHHGVGIGFDFGLSDWHYSFVPHNRFCERDLTHYFVAPAHAAAIHRESTVANNYATRANSTVINNGIGFATIAGVTRGEIARAEIRHVPMTADASSRQERVEREGDRLVIYRPQLSKTPPPQSVRAPGQPHAVSSGATQAGARTTANQSSEIIPPGSIVLRGERGRADAASVPSRISRPRLTVTPSSTPSAGSARPNTVVAQGQGSAVTPPAAIAETRIITPTRGSATASRIGEPFARVGARSETAIAHPRVLQPLAIAASPNRPITEPTAHSTVLQAAPRGDAVRIVPAAQNNYRPPVIRSEPPPVSANRPTPGYSPPPVVRSQPAPVIFSPPPSAVRSTPPPPPVVRSAPAPAISPPAAAPRSAPSGAGTGRKSGTER